MDQAATVQFIQKNESEYENSGTNDFTEHSSDKGTTAKQPLNPENRSNRGQNQSQKRKHQEQPNNRNKKKTSRGWDAPQRRERNVDSRVEGQEVEGKEERRPKKRVA